MKRWVRTSICWWLVRSGHLQVKTAPEKTSMVWQADEDGWLEIADPFSNSRIAKTLSGMTGRHQLCGAYIELITDARVIYGIPFDSSGGMLRYGVIPPNYRNLALHIPSRALVRRFTCRPSVTIECGVTVANAWTNSYFHWLIEILPRIAMVQEFGTKEFDILAGEAMKPWQAESLQMLGIDPSRRVHVAKDFRVKRLLVPSFPRCVIEGRGFSVPCPRRMEALCKRLGVGEYRETTRRIFVSRRKAAGRHVLNEAEVLGVLEKLGFDVAVLEDMTFRAQMELFRNAQIVVGPHGAGLANIVFCRPGSIVIEIVGEFVNASFFTLAASLGLKYGLFQGKCVRRYPATRSDMIVDARELGEFVQRLLG